ncbi:hypothetical protein HK101_008144, partial [Irineochytrium annulatum]
MTQQTLLTFLRLFLSIFTILSFVLATSPRAAIGFAMVGNVGRSSKPSGAGNVRNIGLDSTVNVTVLGSLRHGARGNVMEVDARFKKLDASAHHEPHHPVEEALLQAIHVDVHIRPEGIFSALAVPALFGGTLQSTVRAPLLVLEDIDACEPFMIKLPPVVGLDYAPADAAMEPGRQTVVDGVKSIDWSPSSRRKKNATKTAVEAVGVGVPTVDVNPVVTNLFAVKTISLAASPEPVVVTTITVPLLPTTSPSVATSTQQATTTLQGLRSRVFKFSLTESINTLSATSTITATQSSPSPADNNDNAPKKTRPRRAVSETQPASATSVANPTTPADSLPRLKTNWYALIQRGNCPFDQKLLNAQRAGFAGAMIHNTLDGAAGGDADIPVRMSANAVGEAVELNAMFLTAHDAGGIISLAERSRVPSLLKRGGGDGGGVGVGRFRALWVELTRDGWPSGGWVVPGGAGGNGKRMSPTGSRGGLLGFLADMMFLALAFFVMGVLFTTVCLLVGIIRSYAVYGRVAGSEAGAGKDEALEKIVLPAKVITEHDLQDDEEGTSLQKEESLDELDHEKGDISSLGEPTKPTVPTSRAAGGTRRCCAICIDEFMVGSVVRQLPCNHQFHGV